LLPSARRLRVLLVDKWGISLLSVHRDRCRPVLLAADRVTLLLSAPRVKCNSRPALPVDDRGMWLLSALKDSKRPASPAADQGIWLLNAHRDSKRLASPAADQDIWLLNVHRG